MFIDVGSSMFIDVGSSMFNDEGSSMFIDEGSSMFSADLVTNGWFNTFCFDLALEIKYLIPPRDCRVGKDFWKAIVGFPG